MLHGVLVRLLGLVVRYFLFPYTSISALPCSSNDCTGLVVDVLRAIAALKLRVAVAVTVGRAARRREARTAERRRNMAFVRRGVRWLMGCDGIVDYGKIASS